jgi:hypothetical protein
MKCHSKIILCIFALLMVAGCASTEVTSRQELATGPLPRPGNILVYDFVATPSDVPSDSAFAGEYSEHTTPQSAEEIAAGRQIGAEVAAKLVERIRAMGMPATLASAYTRREINDLVIRGYLISVDQGSAEKRILIGFGSGASELKTAVEGFQVTPQGLRKLGGGTVASGGSKTPGSAMGLATLIATHNPAGLILSTGAKIYGQESGKATIEGRADQTAKEIADQLKVRFQEQGWI